MNTIAQTEQNYAQRKLFEILLNHTEIFGTTNRLCSFVFQINRKMVKTIRFRFLEQTETVRLLFHIFRFALIIFRKVFSVCTVI